MTSLQEPGASLQSQTVSWEQHTKGIGSKLLKKWGWRGNGLGPKENGRVTPLLPKKRKSRETLHARDEVRDEFRLPSDEVVFTRGNRRESEEGGFTRGNKVEREYGDVVPEIPEISEVPDLMDQSEEGIPILEQMEATLKQEYAKIQTKIEEQRQVVKKLEEEKKMIELQDQLIQWVEKHEKECKETISEFSKSTTTTTLQFVYSDLMVHNMCDVFIDDNIFIWDVHENGSNGLKCLQNVEKVLKNCFFLFQNGGLEWRILSKSLNYLLDNCCPQYVDCDGPVMAFVLALPLFCQEIEEWDLVYVLSDPHSEQRQQNLRSNIKDVLWWQNLLKPHVNFKNHSLWSFVNESMVFGKIKNWIKEEWVPSVNDDACIDLLGEWYDHIDLDDFIHKVVLEKLLEKISHWNLNYHHSNDPHSHHPHCHDTHSHDPSYHDPHSHDPHCHDPHSHDPHSHDHSNDPHSHDPHSHDHLNDPHSHDPSYDDPHSHDPQFFEIEFLRPWLCLDFINEEVLILALYKKLHPILSSAWTPLSSSIRQLLQYLQDLSPLLFDRLVDAVILHRLTNYLREDFVINPTDRDLTGIWAVLAWRHVLRVSTLLDILDTVFFPRWLVALAQWLGVCEDYEEIVDWYQTWKDVFLRSDMFYPSIVTQFDRALHLMKLHSFNF